MVSSDVLLAIAALLLSAVTTGLMKIYAQRANLLDIPNQRSSHQIATPRGGGLSIVIVFLGALIWLYVCGDLPTSVFYSLLVGGVLVASIGFADDHGHVAAKWRFLVQLIAATFAVSTLGGLPETQFGSKLVSLGLVGDVLAIVFIVWFANLYNFMDGIDGIAAVEALSIAGSAFVLVSIGSDGVLVGLLLVLAAATLGFLVWNWPPARIFMGDVGSGFIGFILAVFAVISSVHNALPIWCWLILAGVFVVDATITLLTRMIIGEEWYSAHRNHAYQKAARQVGAHRPVTLAVLFINIVWLLPLAWLASARPHFGWWLTVLAWIPLIALAVHFRAGHLDRTD